MTSDDDSFGNLRHRLQSTMGYESCIPQNFCHSLTRQSRAELISRSVGRTSLLLSIEGNEPVKVANAWIIGAR
jgi:hypothetical protein